MLPPEANADATVTGAFVWKMEDVFAVYERPYDPQRPVVCLDETTKQLVAETRAPLPPVPAQDGKPGRPAHYDDEYERRGVSSFFLAWSSRLCLVLVGLAPNANLPLLLPARLQT